MPTADLYDAYKEPPSLDKPPKDGKHTYGYTSLVKEVHTHELTYAGIGGVIGIALAIALRLNPILGGLIGGGLGYVYSTKAGVPTRPKNYSIPDARDNHGV